MRWYHQGIFRRMAFVHGSNHPDTGLTGQVSVEAGRTLAGRETCYPL